MHTGMKLSFKQTGKNKKIAQNKTLNPRNWNGGNLFWGESKDGYSIA
jgi:hypothetical protein